MGQARARGTKEQRVQQALALPPKPRRTGAREQREVAMQCALEFMDKILSSPRRQAPAPVL